ncbi:hypothetical protein G6F66_015219 [Rhizopus arrhizus]|nr:hypothetical protein G6F66_015219 [Rhizopus arrhizus]
MAGRWPMTWSATSLPEPQALVQPRVPWPVFRQRSPERVGPTTGVLSGVMGRRPVQNSAWATCPLSGNKSLTTSSSVFLRASFRRRSKPDSSAMPPTRMRSSKRVTAILYVSSRMVDTGAAASSLSGMVSE